MNKKTGALIDKLQSIALNNIEDKACCGVLEAYRMAGFEWPFDKPIGVSKGMLTALSWYVSMMPKLDSGKPDTRSRLRIRIPYCPFCGKKLAEEESQ
jgi:hypothetical protein